MREAFGGEQGGKAADQQLPQGALRPDHPVPIGRTASCPNYQMVAIGTSRDRTLQAGKLFLIDLNGSEANSHVAGPDAARPGRPHAELAGVGRYYDAEPVGDPSDQPVPDHLVGRPGRVRDAAMAHSQRPTSASTSSTRQRQAPGVARRSTTTRTTGTSWRARQGRAEPARPRSPISTTDTSTTVGALNVYNSSLSTIPQGSAVKVRLIEGFSGEEGFRHVRPHRVRRPVAVRRDSASDATARSRRTFPANMPVPHAAHRQVRDGIANESIWISGRAGEQRFCGGCHENRTNPSRSPPGEQATCSGRGQPRRPARRQLDQRLRARRAATAGRHRRGQPGRQRHPRRAVGPGHPADARQALRELPRRRRQRPRQPELHGHRHDHDDDADVHLRPERRTS